MVGVMESTKVHATHDTVISAFLLGRLLDIWQDNRIISLLQQLTASALGPFHQCNYNFAKEETILRTCRRLVPRAVVFSTSFFFSERHVSLLLFLRLLFVTRNRIPMLVKIIVRMGSAMNRTANIW